MIHYQITDYGPTDTPLMVCGVRQRLRRTHSSLDPTKVTCPRCTHALALATTFALLGTACAHRLPYMPPSTVTVIFAYPLTYSRLGWCAACRRMVVVA